MQCFYVFPKSQLSIQWKDLFEYTAAGDCQVDSKLFLQQIIDNLESTNVWKKREGKRDFDIQNPLFSILLLKLLSFVWRPCHILSLTKQATLYCVIDGISDFLITKAVLVNSVSRKFTSTQTLCKLCRESRQEGFHPKESRFRKLL